MSSPYPKNPKQKKVSKQANFGRLKMATSSDEPSTPQPSQPRIPQAKRSTPTVPQPKRTIPNFFPGFEKEEVTARSKSPLEGKRRQPLQPVIVMQRKRSQGKLQAPPEREEVSKRISQPGGAKALLQAKRSATALQKNNGAESNKIVMKALAAKKTEKKPAKPLESNVEAAIQDFMDYHTVAQKVREDWEQLVVATPLDEKKHLVCCQNKDRNRYPEEIHCLDANRITLLNDDGTEGPFYHANKCCFEGTDRDYIVAQAPMQNTAEEFWKMIFQEQSPTIVVLCDFYEDGKEASEPFWPAKTGEHKYYGTMFVNNKKKDVKNAMTTYTIEVLPDGCSNSLITVLHHFVLWKPAQVVERPTLLLELRRALKAGETGPMTVVSSRGIGRAATFTVIDVILARLLKGVKTRLLDTVVELRKQRAHSIKTVLMFYDVLTNVFLYLRIKVKKYKDAIEKYHTELHAKEKDEKGCCDKEEKLAEKDEKPEEDG